MSRRSVTIVDRRDLRSVSNIVHPDTETFDMRAATGSTLALSLVLTALVESLYAGLTYFFRQDFARFRTALPCTRTRSVLSCPS